MEISDSELRAAMRQVDEEHRSGMASMPVQIAEMHEGEGARGFREERAQILSGRKKSGLVLAIGGAVLTFRQLLTPSVANAAAAGDVAALAAFAQSVELAAVEAYKAAAASGKVKTKGVLDAATLFAGHHTEHAAAFGGAAKTAATNKPTAVVTSASEIPPATAPRPVDFESEIPLNALMMPTTVPNSPTKGPVEPMVARLLMPRFNSA